MSDSPETPTPRSGSNPPPQSSGPARRQGKPGRTVITVAGAKGGVGKTVLSANLAIYLATIGRRVVLVDADATGANAHTFVGTPPSFPSSVENARSEERITPIETSVAGLYVAHGGTDEPPDGSLVRTSLPELFDRVRELNPDYVVVDLGASLDRPFLDFFLASDVSVFVTLPEPTALENTYRFMRHAFARHLRRSAPDQSARRHIVQWLRRTGNAPAPLDLARRLDAAGDPLADFVRGVMSTFEFRFVLNQARVRADLELGDAMTTVVKRRFGLDVDYVGYIDFDDTVWSCVRNRRPLLVESPGTKASKSIEKIARRLLSLDARSRLREPRQGVPPESHHDLLEVERGTTDEEVRRSFKRLKDIYSLDALCCYGLFDSRSIEALRARLEEAYDVLLDPARRRPYELSIFPAPALSEQRPVLRDDGSRPPAPAITPESEFSGDLLRAVRESQGLEVADIARRTKIGVRYLVALEAEEFTRLPAPVYVGGFVSEVAKCLKLDPHRVSRSYLRRYQQYLSQREKSGGMNRAGLILASASPRRKAILEQLGIAFEVVPANTRELISDGESPKQFAARMAKEKAVAVSTRKVRTDSAATVLGADTVVSVGGTILGKPRDRADARRMLGLLSGRAHLVFTAVALAREGKPVGDVVVVTEVEFRALSPELIEAYLKTGEGDDKAGSYAIQGIGAGLVKHIHGSYSSVVGLPAVETLELLEAAGVVSDWPRAGQPKEC